MKTKKPKHCGAMNEQQIIHSLRSEAIFFNVDRADQLDCRRLRDKIKDVVNVMIQKS